jgi:hypothetical protein
VSAPHHLARLSAEDVAAMLEARRAGEGRWSAKCPAHGDKGPSLSIREGDDARVLLHCFAGCSFTAIVQALGVEPRQLFPDTDATAKPRRPRIDPDRQGRELFDRLSNLLRLPPTKRLNDELQFIGDLLLLGTARYPEESKPCGFTRGGKLYIVEPDKIRSYVLRVILLAVVDLVAQGTPRRWFSPLAIARVVDAAAGERGYARRLRVYAWCRAAIRVSREVAARKKEASHA